MFAIIETGGKQIRVEEGQKIETEYLEGQAGDKLTIEKVLMFRNQKNEVQIGTPLIQGAKVECTIVDQGKAKKVLVYKFKRRKKYRKLQGHRQLFTSLHVEKIKISSGKKKKVEKLEDAEVSES